MLDIKTLQCVRLNAFMVYKIIVNSVKVRRYRLELVMAHKDIVIIITFVANNIELHMM